MKTLRRVGEEVEQVEMKEEERVVVTAGGAMEVAVRAAVTEVGARGGATVAPVVTAVTVLMAEA